MFVDGKPAEAIRVDYILRGMELPAGEHSIEWRFRAPYWGMVHEDTQMAVLAVAEKKTNKNIEADSIKEIATELRLFP